MQLRLRRPPVALLEATAAAAVDAVPAGPGAHRVTAAGTVGHGVAAFDAGVAVLRAWEAHEIAGVATSRTPLVEGATVGLSARTFGVWLVFACRVVDLVDEPDRFGFVYATLPGHPERGRESFVLRRVSSPAGDLTVVFEIEAESEAGSLVTRLAGPVARVLQRRFTAAYVEAMRSAVAARVT
ncbi:MAG: DUF1990 domain-containing protein [Actinomycetota bacterium]